jgi:hemolysin D
MPHVALWSACALFICAIAWSFIGKMDVVVVAGGKVLAIGKTKAIQSVEPQIVRRVLVSEGQSVAEGDILIEFDPRSAEADQKRYRADHERALAMQWINETLLISLGDRPVSAP